MKSEPKRALILRDELDSTKKSTANTQTTEMHRVTGAKVQRFSLPRNQENACGSMDTS